MSEKPESLYAPSIKFSIKEINSTPNIQEKNNHRFPRSASFSFPLLIDHAHYIDCATLEWSVMIILSLFPIFSQLITACATEEGFVYILHNQQLMG